MLVTTDDERETLRPPPTPEAVALGESLHPPTAPVPVEQRTTVRPGSR